MPLTLVTLPHGFTGAEGWVRTAWLREFTGADELFLLEKRQALNPAVLTTALLARCVAGFGEEASEPAALGLIRGLTLGDREALLLSLRSQVFGDVLSCVLPCVQPECREPMELELRVSDLIQPPNANARQWYERKAALSDGDYLCRFRIPTGAEEEAAAARASENLPAAIQEMLRACVAEICRDGESRLDANVAQPSDVSPELADVLSAWFVEFDPQSELLLDLICPACGAPFQSRFDAGDFFFRELSAFGGGVFRDLHVLASHYHWSETDILALPLPRRRLYLGLIAASRETVHS